MRKVLYATTALATAAACAGAAGDAVAQEYTSKAAERIQVRLSGYFQQWVVGARQNINDGPGDIQPIAGAIPNTIKTNAVDVKRIA